MVADRALRPTPTAVPTATGIPSGNATSAQPSSQPGQSPECVASSIIKVRDPASGGQHEDNDRCLPTAHEAQHLGGPSGCTSARSTETIRPGNASRFLRPVEAAGRRSAARSCTPTRPSAYWPGSSQRIPLSSATRAGRGSRRGARRRRAQSHRSRLWQAGCSDGRPACFCEAQRETPFRLAPPSRVGFCVSGLFAPTGASYAACCGPARHRGVAKEDLKCG